MFNLFRREKDVDPAIKRRVPPGQVLTEKWPVLHYGSVPKMDTATWKMSVSGLVEQPFSWTWEEFQALPQYESTSDIHCVTRWSKLDNHWEGVKGSTVLDLCKPLPAAKFVIAHAPNGFTANLPIESLRDDDVLFAWKHNGEVLTPEHGYPLRLVVPKRYFWKSTKWITGLEFLPGDKLGFWEQLGYHNEADPWREERFWGD